MRPRTHSSSSKGASLDVQRQGRANSAHIPSASTGPLCAPVVRSTDHAGSCHSWASRAFPSSALILSMAGALIHSSMKASTCLCVTNTQSKQKGCRTPQHMPGTHDCARVGSMPVPVPVPVPLPEVRAFWITMRLVEA